MSAFPGAVAEMAADADGNRLRVFHDFATPAAQ
jgi:hypothetical protein